MTEQHGTNGVFANYGRDYQRKIVQALLSDKKFAEQMYEVLDVEYFGQHYLKFIVRTCFEYFRKYRAFPSKDIITVIAKDKLKSSNEKKVLFQIVSYFKEIKENPLNGDLEYVKDSSLDFCKKQSLREALSEAVDLIHKSKYDEISKKIKQALEVGTSNDIGHDFFRDIEKRHVEDNRDPISTGFSQLDGKDILNGGWGSGELGIIMGSTGVGKSSLLTIFGANAVRKGYNVIHYTFELSEKIVGLRYDANFTDISQNYIIDNKEKVNNVVCKMLNKKECGNLLIKEYPTKSASVQTLRNHIEKVITQKDFRPNLLVVDYADIMRSVEKYEAKRFELESVYEELRSLSMEMGIPVITASQTNRSGSKNDIVTLDSIAESFAKAMVADIILTISRMDEDKQQKKARMYVAKNRIGVDGIVFPVKFDTSTIKMSMDSALSFEEIASESLDDQENFTRRLKKKLADIKGSN